MKFTIQDVCVNTKTKQELIFVLTILEKVGFLWRGGDKPLSWIPEWNNYCESTVIFIRESFGYANIQWAIDKKFKVLTINQFLNIITEDTPKANTLIDYIDTKSMSIRNGLFNNSKFFTSLLEFNALSTCRELLEFRLKLLKDKGITNEKG
ncbi:MAG: hypothetical protein M0P71_00850 [Melioribacteraceae bacterium]|nr:hypothetical protein [Melioribacteraceae bacterium]